jgi:molybdopterin converting factor small subunit
MQVSLYATFRLHAGVKTFALDLPAGTTVMQAILEITRRYPVLRPHWLNQDGELHAHVHAFVNGDDVSTLPAGILTPLPADAALDFFPPVAGG